MENSMTSWNQLTAHFQGKAPDILDFGLKLVFVLVVFLIGRKIIHWLEKLTSHSLEKAEVEKASQHFILSVLKALLYVILVSMLATSLGVKEASILALLGSMGVGIVLALKESLSNLAGGFILLIMKPFQSGDYIREDSHGNEGQVIKIDMFYTTLKMMDNRTVCIPNGILTNNSLINYSRLGKRQFREKIGISYHADIKEARRCILEVLKKDPDVIQTESMEVVVAELGDSAIILEWHAFVEASLYLAVKWRITEEIKEAFDANGIEIPFSQLDVHICSVPDQI